MPSRPTPTPTPTSPDPLARTAVRLRAADPADVGALLAIERACFAHDRLSARSFAALVRGPTALALVAEAPADDGALAGRGAPTAPATDRPALAGYALVLLRRTSARARLYSIAVGPEHAGRGIARRLLGAAEGAARRAGRTSMTLEVDASNGPALALYAAAGYTLTKRLPAYYADGADALRLERRIAPPSPDATDPSARR